MPRRSRTADFAAARASVEDLFTDDLEPVRHSWLTFAFNRDLDLARREIGRARKRLDAGHLLPAQLLVSAPDAAFALELVQRHTFYSFGHLGFDLVEALGLAARPVLEAALEKIFERSAKQYQKPAIAALKFVQ